MKYITDLTRSLIVINTRVLNLLEWSGNESVLLLFHSKVGIGSTLLKESPSRQPFYC